jgi:hypothetical protein|tara:strand:- start:1664 stop:1876 length:213 start_codon:yes stop_codon:yes gene_type:complete
MGKQTFTKKLKKAAKKKLAIRKETLAIRKSDASHKSPPSTLRRCSHRPSSALGGSFLTVAHTQPRLPHRG